MQSLNVISLLQQITTTTVGSVVLPVVAGLAVLYVGIFLIKKGKKQKQILDTPSPQEVINSFIQSFFSGEWDSIETRIELEYFKTKVIQGNAAVLREFTTKLLSSNSPYILPSHRENLNVILQELDIYALINRDIAVGTIQQQTQAIALALHANNTSAIPYLEKLATQQTGEVRLQALTAIVQLSDFQPTFFKTFAAPLTDAEYSHLVALYADKKALLETNINTWLIASQPQLVKFCLLLAKHYQITVDSRTLQYLGFHQDKKLGALAMEILDGYLHQDKATENLLQYRKTTILQHNKGENTPSSNSNLAMG